MKKARRGEAPAPVAKPAPVRDGRDVLSAVFATWSAPQLFRFAVALDACLGAPVPAAPRAPAKVGRETVPGESAALADAQCAWALACSATAEAARYARQTLVRVDADDGAEAAVSLAAFLRGLCARFDAHFRVSLFAGIDSEDERDTEAARAAAEAALLAETRACAALLFANDARVQRLLMGDAERFFACTPPPPARALSFVRAVAPLAEAFTRGQLALGELGAAAAEAWILGW